jgi:hypothetical protein
MKIKLLNVRLAFPSLFEAKAFAGSDKATFGASLLFDGKGDPATQYAELTGETDATGKPITVWKASTVRKVIAMVAKDKWAAKADATLKPLLAGERTCLRDGDMKSQWGGFEGNLYLSSSSEKRPLVVNADKTPLVAADGKPYGGCYVNAVVDIWAQDNQYGKRINATLQSVQFFADGDSFAGGSFGTEDDFDDVSAGATADDLS